MHSSIICSANPLLFNCTSTGLPFLFNIILASFELKSIHPLSMDFSCKLLAHFSNRNKRSFTLSYSAKTLGSFSSNAFTFAYVQRWSECIRLGTMVYDVHFPAVSICILQVSVHRSTFGFNEQIPFDNSNGSIGTTRSAK